VKKYAPKKVFVLESNDYVEITYKELCEREKCDPSYKKKLFIPLHGMIMEVDKDAYLEFYKTQRRQKYIYERSKDNNDIILSVAYLISPFLRVIKKADRFLLSICLCI